MKILFLIDTLKGYGAEKSITEIVIRLDNITPVVVHLYEGDDLKTYLEANGVEVISLNISAKYGFNEAIKKLIPIIKNVKPLIIHSTLFRADMVARKLKSKFPDILLVGSFVSNSYSSLRYSQLDPIAKLKLFSTQVRDLITSGKVDYFVANSKTIKNSNSSLLRVPKEKITTIYRGRDIKLFNKVSNTTNLINKLPDLSNLVCFVNIGRLQRSKGQLDLIKAFRLFNDKYPLSILLIAGEGRLEQELKNEIENQELLSAVYLLGYIDNVKELLGVSHYFIFPSYFEGLPGGVIEATLSKIPCIVSDIPEIRECFPQNGALFFPPGDIGAIYHKMEEATKMKDWRKRTEKSFELAKKNFDIELIIKRYEEFYFKILKDKLKN